MSRDEAKQILIKHALDRYDAEFQYQLLSRMQSDCDYYLGCGERNAKHALWAKDESDHIAIMRELWTSFSDDKKPEWLTNERINEYSAQMGVA